MEDEVLVLSDYLPIRITEPRLYNLVEHHLSSFLACIEHELYSSSLLHLHILYMVFVYLQLQRIADIDENAFKLSLIGFSRDEKNILKEPKFPLSFSVISEKTVFRLFRLNNFEDELIKTISEPVNRRNNHSHASEFVECQSVDEFEKIFSSYLKNMDEILKKNTNIYKKLFTDPSVQQLNEDDYEITDDDLATSVFSPNYFSIKEIGLVCAGRTDNLSLKILKNFGFELEHE